MKNKAIRYGIAIAVCGLALWFSFRGQDLSALGAQMQSANMWYILLGVMMQFASHSLRAWRWQIFLVPVKADTSFFNAFKALIAGYGMNNVIPRAGEIVRPVMFARREKISIPSTIATIVIERVSDLFGLIIFGLASLYLFENELLAAYPTIAASLTTIFGVSTILLIICVTIFLNETRTAAFVRWITRPLPVRFKEKIHRAAHSFAQGLAGVKSRAFTAFIACTLGIWLLYAVSMYVSLYAFQDTALRSVGFDGAIMLQMLAGLAFIVPTPGGTGSYHYVIKQALMVIFGVTETIALAYATLTHGANYIATTLLGLGFMLAEGVSVGELEKEVKTANQDEPQPNEHAEPQPVAVRKI